MFEIYTRNDGQFSFRLKAKNGQVILVGEAYTSKSGCENGVASVKENSTDIEMFEKLTAKDGSPYFVLKAKNGQIIGNSEMYSSESARDNGIDSVMTNAPDAEVIEIE